MNLSHNSGHLLNDLSGWKGDAHVSPFHLASYVFIGGGLWLITTGWKHLFEAQKAQLLATTGPYAHVRHPQYSGFVLIMVGFLLQWPTFATLLIFPVLLFVYRRLAIREERDVAAEFGAAWEAYAQELPRFVPRPRRLRHRHTAAQHQAKPATEAKAGAPGRTSCRRRQEGAQSMTVVADDSMAKMEKRLTAVQRFARTR